MSICLSCVFSLDGPVFRRPSCHCNNACTLERSCKTTCGMCLAAELELIFPSCGVVLRHTTDWPTYNWQALHPIHQPTQQHYTYLCVCPPTERKHCCDFLQKIHKFIETSCLAHKAIGPSYSSSDLDLRKLWWIFFTAVTKSLKITSIDLANA